MIRPKTISVPSPPTIAHSFQRLPPSSCSIVISACEPVAGRNSGPHASFPCLAREDHCTNYAAGYRLPARYPIDRAAADNLVTPVKDDRLAGGCDRAVFAGEGDGRRSGPRRTKADLGGERRAPV